MKKISGDDLAARLAEMEARFQRQEAELEALRASGGRSAGSPGWYQRPIKPPSAEKLAKGSKPGRWHCDRILPGGHTVSFYIGGNGKLTVSGHYGTRGITAWKGDRKALAAYLADTGPNGFAADLDRCEASGHWANGIG